MAKVYGLAIEKPHGLVTLALPLMTLPEAESARDGLAAWGKIVLVINLQAQ